MYVIEIYDPGSDHYFYGPFSTKEEANHYATKSPYTAWNIHKLNKPGILSTLPMHCQTCNKLVLSKCPNCERTVQLP